MPAVYDSYCYPRYWSKREYEDRAEKLALKKFLEKIPQKGSLIDIGGGYGRLAETYLPFFKKCLLVEPSQKLLKLAKKNLGKHPRLEFRKGRAEKLPAKSGRFDVALIVRVSHHLPQLEKVFQEVHRVLKPKGFLVFEFANKVHFKAALRAILKRRLAFLWSHLPVDLSTRKKVPFLNYHPNQIKTLLLSNQFKIIRVLSVSNFRHPWFKKLIPLKILLLLESGFSLLISHFSPPFGPSVFILAQKD